MGLRLTLGFHGLTAAVSRFVLLLLIAGMLWTGCDNNEIDDTDERNDADLLVGVWNATSIKAGPFDVLSLVGLSMTLTLQEDGSAAIDAVDDNGNVTALRGTYTVDEQNKTVTLDGDDVDRDLVIVYEFIDDNALSGEFPASDLVSLGIVNLPEQIARLLEDNDELTISVDLVRDTGS